MGGAQTWKSLTANLRDGDAILHSEESLEIFPLVSDHDVRQEEERWAGQGSGEGDLKRQGIQARGAEGLHYRLR